MSAPDHLVDSPSPGEPADRWQWVEGWADVVDPGEISILHRPGHGQSPAVPSDELDVILCEWPPAWWDEAAGGCVIPQDVVQATKRLARRQGLSDEAAFRVVADVLNRQHLLDE